MLEFFGDQPKLLRLCLWLRTCAVPRRAAPLADDDIDELGTEFSSDPRRTSVEVDEEGR